MCQPLPQAIRGTYKGQREVVQYAHDDAFTVITVYTYHGETHKWRFAEGRWSKVER